MRTLSAAVALSKSESDVGSLLAQDSNSNQSIEQPHDHLDIQNPGCGYSQDQLGIGQFSSDQASKEVSGVNKHTRNVEFYGSSSSVALLSRIRKTGDVEDALNDEGDEGDLVSSLHNPAFSPGATDSSQIAHSNPDVIPGSIAYHQQCRPFLDSFFTTLHYLNPILDKTEFLTNCTLLWNNHTTIMGQSFIALYYSVLSLGALVAIREDEAIDNIGNLRWSRIFFEEARRRANVNMMTDIEMVQCYFFLVRDY